MVRSRHRNPLPVSGSLRVVDFTGGGCVQDFDCLPAGSHGCRLRRVEAAAGGSG